MQAEYRAPELRAEDRERTLRAHHYEDLSKEIPRPDSVSTTFLTDCLRAAGHAGVEVLRFNTQPIGTGQIGHCLRYQLTLRGGDGSAPARLVGKFPALDRKSRISGVLMRNYLKEVSFYRELQARVRIRTPRCYYAAIDGPGPSFMLLLEDLAPASQGDQLQGCSAEVADAAVQELVGLHAPSWCDSALMQHTWLDPATPEMLRFGRALYAHNVRGVLRRYGDHLDLDEATLLANVGRSRAAPFELLGDVYSLVHVDYRLDNILIDPRLLPPRVCTVDWQSVMLGNPLSDVAYFLGAGLLPEVRREAERDIVRRYHEGLCKAAIRGYSWERCWHDYRRGSFTGLVVTVIASLMVKQTERGDEMFTAMARRHARHVLDLGAEELMCLEQSPRGSKQRSERDHRHSGHAS
jgi:hypothetical protein